MDEGAEIDKSDLMCYGYRENGILETVGIKWSENRYEKISAGGRESKVTNNMYMIF